MNEEIPPRENLVDTIEFNFYQGQNDFDANSWYKYIDEIEAPFYEKIAKLEVKLAKAVEALEFVIKNAGNLNTAKSYCILILAELSEKGEGE